MYKIIKITYKNYRILHYFFVIDLTLYYNVSFTVKIYIFHHLDIYYAGILLLFQILSEMKNELPSCFPMIFIKLKIIFYSYI